MVNRLGRRRGAPRQHARSSPLGAGMAPAIGQGVTASACTAGRRQGGEEYAMWDAAYLLGCLSARDRRRFETHLRRCVRCSAAVDLRGVVALLSLLDESHGATLGGPRRADGGASAPCRHRVTLRHRRREAIGHRDAAHWIAPRRARHRAARR